MRGKTAPALLAVAALALVLTGCGASGPSPEAELNDCIVTVGTVYVTQYGPLDADTWQLLRDDCADQVQRGEWQ
jgi:hypothetical protein